MNTSDRIMRMRYIKNTIERFEENRKEIQGLFFEEKVDGNLGMRGCFYGRVDIPTIECPVLYWFENEREEEFDEDFYKCFIYLYGSDMIGKMGAIGGLMRMIVNCNVELKSKFIDEKCKEMNDMIENFYSNDKEFMKIMCTDMPKGEICRLIKKNGGSKYYKMGKKELIRYYVELMRET